MRFTPENARQYAIRANEIRWHSPPPVATPESPPDNPRVARIEKQLNALDDAIDAGGHTAAAWRDLTAARERLFKQWQVLANIPNPGNLKPTKPRSSRPSGPIDPEPMPQ